MSPLYFKLAAGATALALLGAGFSSWLARGAEIERLEAWQATVVTATSVASKNPKLTADQVPGAVALLRASKDNCEAALERIDDAADRDKALQTKLDSQLDTILEHQDQSAEATKARLDALRARQSTGDQVQDCAAIEADSNAAWDGWRK